MDLGAKYIRKVIISYDVRFKRIVTLNQMRKIIMILFYFFVFVCKKNKEESLSIYLRKWMYISSLESHDFYFFKNEYFVLKIKGLNFEKF